MEKETPCMCAAWKTILKKYVNRGKKGMSYILKLVC